MSPGLKCSHLLWGVTMGTLGVGSASAQEVVLDTRGAPAEMARRLASPDTEGLAVVLDEVGSRGEWLLPAQCAEAATPRAWVEPAREALFSQDQGTLYTLLQDALMTQICRTTRIPESEWFELLFWFGVEAVSRGDEVDALRWFGAIHHQVQRPFLPPDLGKRVRELYEAAAQTPALEGVHLALDGAGKGQWYVAGTELPDAGVRLDRVPQLVQRVVGEDDCWTTVLIPEDKASWKSLSYNLIVSDELIHLAVIGSFRSDVARWLRVYSGQRVAGIEVPGQVAISAGLQQTDDAAQLRVLWESPDGTTGEWVEAEPPPPQLVWWWAGLGVERLRGVPAQRLDLGLSVPMAGKWRFDAGITAAFDYGSQGPGVRLIAGGEVGLRHLVGESGVSWSPEFTILTRGPDPYDPQTLVVQIYPGVEVGYHLPGRWDLIRLEVGAALAPGWWRSDGQGAEGPGGLLTGTLGAEWR